MAQYTSPMRASMQASIAPETCSAEARRRACSANARRSDTGRMGNPAPSARPWVTLAATRTAGE